jgi:HPt (histidine-containing phosphotransfer) domain-containing protein
MFMVSPHSMNAGGGVMEIGREIEMVRKLVPDLDSRISHFEVEDFEMDDELLAAFCEELDRLSGDLRSGLDTSNYRKTRVAAHSMKGMGGTMGLPEISVLAQEIEQTLDAGQKERCEFLSKELISWARDFVAKNQRS